MDTQKDLPSLPLTQSELQTSEPPNCALPPGWADLADDFLMLEYEAHQNGNCNFCFFPESAARFRDMANRLREAVTPHIDPDESEDDDNAVCLLMQMVDDSPRYLPTTDDEAYQALRRVLTRIGILPNTKVSEPGT